MQGIQIAIAVLGVCMVAIIGTVLGVRHSMEMYSEMLAELALHFTEYKDWADKTLERLDKRIEDNATGLKALNEAHCTMQKKFEEIKGGFTDIEDYSSGEHWYDEVLYPVSFHKKGKGLTDRFNSAAKEYIDLFAAELAAAEKCPAEQKRERVRGFAQKLAANDGPAVSMMSKLFGKETMRRNVLKHMYGV